MSTRNVAWSPKPGWSEFGGSEAVEELVWETLAGWHYLNPTVNQSVWESPLGATVTLAFDVAHTIIELVVGHDEEDEVELEELLTRLRREFSLAPESES